MIDFLQDFIDTCRLAYGFNQLHFYSTPSFTKTAGLRKNKLDLDYITNDKHSLLLENNVRGGVSSVIGDRHVKREKKQHRGIFNIYMLQLCLITYQQEFFMKLILQREIKLHIKNTFLKTPDKTKREYLLESDLENPSRAH